MITQCSYIKLREYRKLNIENGYLIRREDFSGKDKYIDLDLTDDAANIMFNIIGEYNSFVIKDIEEQVYEYIKEKKSNLESFDEIYENYLRYKEIVINFEEWYFPTKKIYRFKGCREKVSDRYIRILKECRLIRNNLQEAYGRYKLLVVECAIKELENKLQKEIGFKAVVKCFLQFMSKIEALEGIEEELIDVFNIYLEKEIEREFTETQKKEEFFFSIITFIDLELLNIHKNISKVLKLIIDKAYIKCFTQREASERKILVVSLKELVLALDLQMGDIVEVEGISKDGLSIGDVIYINARKIASKGNEIIYRSQTKKPFEAGNTCIFDIYPNFFEINEFSSMINKYNICYKEEYIGYCKRRVIIEENGIPIEEHLEQQFNSPKKEREFICSNLQTLEEYINEPNLDIKIYTGYAEKNFNDADRKVEYFNRYKYYINLYKDRYENDFLKFLRNKMDFEESLVYDLGIDDDLIDLSI